MKGRKEHQQSIKTEWGIHFTAVLMSINLFITVCDFYYNVHPVSGKFSFYEFIPHFADKQ